MKLVVKRLLLGMPSLLVLAAAVGCSSKPPVKATAKDCGVGTVRLISDSGIGVLGVGAPIAGIAERCHVLADTTWSDEEAMPERALLIQLGNDTITAVIDRGRIWRLELNAAGWLTSDSLGVGSTVARLTRLPGARALSGESRYYLRVPGHCGLSFRLPVIELPESLSYPEVLEGAALHQLLADTLRAETVLVVGCHVMEHDTA
jgi:hypothetical protein